MPEAAVLPSREHNILRGRAAGKTLEALGEELGYTRERIRQLEKHGLRLVRTLDERNTPKGFFYAERFGLQRW